jgi:hypothetical protein
MYVTNITEKFQAYFLLAVSENSLKLYFLNSQLSKNQTKGMGSKLRI